MKELFFFLSGVAIFALTVLVFLAIIMLPVAYWEGSSKAAWLKRTQGVELTWWQAAPLDVRINDVDATLKTKQP